MKIVFVTSSVTLLREITSPLWRTNVFLSCWKHLWEIVVYNTIFRTQDSPYFLRLHNLSFFYAVYCLPLFSYIFISVLFNFFLSVFYSSSFLHFLFLPCLLYFSLPSFFLSLIALSFLSFFDFSFLPSYFLFFPPFFPLSSLFFPSCICFLFPLDMVFSLTIFFCVSFLAFYISNLLYNSIHNCNTFAVTGSKAKSLGVVVIGLSGKQHFYRWRY